MSETITLTFGDAGENHAGMKMVGNVGKIGSGFNLKDLLNIKFNKKKESYWIDRKKNLGSMKKQF